MIQRRKKDYGLNFLPKKEALGIDETAGGKINHFGMTLFLANPAKSREDAVVFSVEIEYIRVDPNEADQHG